MSDTAEYWWDIKDHHVYMGPTFRHHPVHRCSHYNPHSGNVLTTPYIEDINCYECKEWIKNNGTDGLLEGKASPDFYMTKTAGKKWRKDQEEIKRIGRCPCGSRWVERTNKATGERFFGCLRYPKCKNTKPIGKEQK